MSSADGRGGSTLSLCLGPAGREAGVGGLKRPDRSGRAWNRRAQSRIGPACHSVISSYAVGTPLESVGLKRQIYTCIAEHMILTAYALLCILWPCSGKSSLIRPSRSEERRVGNEGVR